MPKTPLSPIASKPRSKKPRVTITSHKKIPRTPEPKPKKLRQYRARQMRQRAQILARSFDFFQLQLVSNSGVSNVGYGLFRSADGVLAHILNPSYSAAAYEEYCVVKWDVLERSDDFEDVPPPIYASEPEIIATFGNVTHARMFFTVLRFGLTGKYERH